MPKVMPACFSCFRILYNVQLCTLDEYKDANLTSDVQVTFSHQREKYAATVII